MSASDSGGGAKEKAAQSKVQAAKVGIGLVTNILSGSTVVISGQASKDKKPPEKKIILSGINAPRLQRTSKEDDKDEPYAWEAREFLRKLLIGKQVQFIVNHTDKNNREYGNLMLDGASVVEAMVSAGFATVKRSEKKERPVHPDREPLLGLEEGAKSAGRGQFAAKSEGEKEKHVRELKWTSGDENFDFYQKNKGKPVPVVIEYVRTGSTLMCEVASEDRKHMMIAVALCGIVIPRLDGKNTKRKGKKDDKSGKKDEGISNLSIFAEHAQWNVAKRLLKRDMLLYPLGIDLHGNLYGVVQFKDYPGRDITKWLLKRGLGRFLPWTAAMCDPKLAEEYKKCEMMAQAEKSGIWQFLVPKKAESKIADSKTSAVAVAGARVSVKVLMVSSGDSCTVIDSKGAEKRIYLASIRCPRIDRRDPAKSEPLAFEAKEWLRKKLVGKRVTIQHEYSRSNTAFVTLYQGKFNINTQLCTLGYAKVVPHRLDEQRASNYVQLVEEQKMAEKKGVGQHASPKPTPHSYIDLTEQRRGKDDKKKEKKSNEAERAKALLPELSGELRGHVEYVISASKYKVYLATKKIMCNVILAGVQVPRPGGRNEMDTKYGGEATALARSLILQQNVIVKLNGGENGVDKRGSFFGYLSTESRKNVACALLEKGLAKISNIRAAESAGFLEDFRKSERVAKSKRLRVWENFDKEEKERREKRQAAKEEEKRSKNLKIKVTEIVDGVSFYAQLLSNKDLSKVESGLAAIDASETAPEDFEVEFGIVAACKYGDSWHRVQVNDVDEIAGTADVLFIDYGNKETANIVDLIPIPENLSAVPSLASKYQLAGILAPKDGGGWTTPAYNALGEMIYDQTFDAEIVTSDNKGTTYVVIEIKSTSEDTKKEKKVPVQAELLRDGLARLVPRPDYTMRYLTREFRNYQAEGIDHRRGIWEYGELSDEEEEDAGRGRRKRK
mmetsp:Transcript_17218/g.25824  ORF Transcript_17218/g.25824 Transcript_17218/m.25824 type:complete len:953 (-) Transcript_17218:144-3002(-)|eukprot:CAMPEP_0167764000 /NCGR_PEP_ID=MMETSP0110_2-20121227/13750_1 /TAXON_ID=629695 /ORGANISM="Gymnochlora sp., Strain CCMP2014" /LENGTH=952 /DNA_ID=CAMNT_0007651277 /DNA_START=94 /DNA_END=2952 /DNA_ORIENTATION=+